MKNEIEKNIRFLDKRIVIYLVIIASIGISIRFYYFPENLPVVLDALTYFNYAYDLSVTGIFPINYNFPNNGWPLFLSLFFSIFQSSILLDLMNIQKILTVIISILTILPVYLLCNRFFKKEYAVTGAALFVLDPRIIQNSLQGTTEPLFIFLGATALFLFLNKNTKLVYTAFGILALFSIIRYEGLLLIIPCSIMLILRLRDEKQTIIKYFIALSIFIILLIPFVYLRMETIGQDGLVSHVTAGAIATDYFVNDKNEGVGFNFFINGAINITKYIGWVLIPNFIIFIPLGIYHIFKNRDYKKNTIILVAFVMLIPAFYAYARDIQDTRYLYIILPLFSVISLYTIEQFKNKISGKDITILITVIILTSIIFLEIKQIDYEHEIEAYQISKKIVDMTYVINDFYPETAYVRVSGLEKEFPIVINGETFGPKLLPVEGFSTVREFIEANTYLKIDHIVIDDKKNRPQFLKDVFNNEEQYTFLIKKFDSSEYGYNYHVKIFEIDFDKFKINSEKGVIPHN